MDRLLGSGQYIPGLHWANKSDLVQLATITASSELVLTELPENSFVKFLELSVAQMVPLSEGKVEPFVFHARSGVETTLLVAPRYQQ